MIFLELQTPKLPNQKSLHSKIRKHLYPKGTHIHTRQEISLASAQTYTTHTLAVILQADAVNIVCY